ncbi:Imm1 family immunity protein [Actinokineospora sp. NBRC 105648]|uniref:Imm1 family immunity protein n=1 Tax=Actinokineospora sp. NBRC 105648 TaxID=3032206 RepID=UPI0024A1DE6D|nr:Imm1 family immunity protein [Actinokineospora sp. NBRC 105648]GLZ39828.1 hypothetical protein Acsp05_34520 [Actinokineospora sp. NBRC 105648]
MTIDAYWAIDHPDGSQGGDRVQLTSQADVVDFVRRISLPGALLASLVHLGRPLWEQARQLPDHDVFAAVHDGFGYLSYQDMASGKHYPIGLPGSPGGEYDDDEFPPGSGISIKDLTTAVAEFLDSAAIPTCLAWRRG